MNKENGIPNTTINETYQEQISNLDKYTHNEIANLYKFINDTIVISLRNNSQSINEFGLRLDEFENKHKQQKQTNDFNYNEIISLKQQLIQLKQVNDEYCKSSQSIGGNLEQNDQSSQILQSKAETCSTNDIEFLKNEIKMLKEKVDSAYSSSQEVMSPLSQINEIQTKDIDFLSNDLQKENRKIKSDLSSIKSEIKKIISRTLDNEKTEIKELSFDEESAAILESNYETTNFDEIDENQFTQKSRDINNVINTKVNKIILENESLKNDFNSLKIQIGKLIENQNQSAEIPEKFIQEVTKQIESFNNKSNHVKETIDQIVSENESLKNNLTNLQSDIAQINKKLKEKGEKSKETTFYYLSPEQQYEVMDCSFAENELQLKAIEANNNSVNAQLKASEAESKAIDANEKADRIVSDNNKMNVDIRCLKYEVKKLRSRVKELECSEICSDLADRIDYTLSKVHKLKNEFKQLKSEKDAELNKSVDSTQNEKISDLIEENESLKDDIKTLKSEVMKIKEGQSINESIIPDDFIQKIKDAHSQSFRAYEKASKMHRDISENQNKTNEMNDKVEKLIEENEKLKTDLNALIAEVDKIKESRRDDDSKSQKKKEKKRKHSSIKV